MFSQRNNPYCESIESPLTRRKCVFHLDIVLNVRNTSTYAEKTGPAFFLLEFSQKHLRAHEENRMEASEKRSDKETPPRTRRKLKNARARTARIGNTSAYAEKTGRNFQGSGMTKKHLRLRGENRILPLPWGASLETPPLARRKLGYRARLTAFKRNTSACAEKTVSPSHVAVVAGKHLRLRGENPARSASTDKATETPPRTRRKLRKSAFLNVKQRNTSAYAEKTRPCRCRQQISQKHLRVRGENQSADTNMLSSSETPPRTRRKLSST